MSSGDTLISVQMDKRSPRPGQSVDTVAVPAESAVQLEYIHSLRQVPRVGEAVPTSALEDVSSGRLAVPEGTEKPQTSTTVAEDSDHGSRRSRSGSKARSWDSRDEISDHGSRSISLVSHRSRAPSRQLSPAP